MRIWKFDLRVLDGRHINICPARNLLYSSQKILCVWTPRPTYVNSGEDGQFNDKTLRYRRGTARRSATACWNLLYCCTYVRKILSEKACHRWMTLEATQGRRNCRCSISYTSLPISGLNYQRVCLAQFPRYYKLFPKIYTGHVALKHPIQG